MNTTATWPTLNRVEDAAAQEQRHVNQLVDYAAAGDWRHAPRRR